MSAEPSLYDQIYTGFLRMLMERRREPSFTIEQLRGMLETQYVYEGNDWVGRGRVSEIKTAAVIAAYEHVLAEWERELK